MNIKAESITIELSNQEARDLAYHIKDSLQSSIKSHYIQTYHDGYDQGLEEHAKPLFEEQCRKDLNMMNQIMACASGESSKWLEKELWSFLENEYKKLNIEEKK